MKEGGVTCFAVILRESEEKVITAPIVFHREANCNAYKRINNVVSG